MWFFNRGGVAHGKNCACPKTLENTKYPYLSIDHLKMGLIRSGYTSLTPMSDDRDLTDYLWPIVREMIKTAVENGQNLLSRAALYPVRLGKDFTEEYRAQTQYRCLVMSEAYIRSHYQDIRRTPAWWNTDWMTPTARWKHCFPTTQKRWKPAKNTAFRIS